jgi:hypothetical protein
MAASLAAAYADVIYLYTARVTLAPVQSPVAFNRLVYWCPLSPRINVANYGSWQNSSGYAFTLYNVTASGSQYLVRWPFTVFNLSQAGTVTIRLNGSSASFQMSAGSYYSIYLIFSGPLASPLYLSGNLSFEPSSSPGIFYIYRETVTLLPPPQDVLSFVDGQSYQATMVYQGDIDSAPVRNVITPVSPTYWWPSDISGALAQQYWSWWYPNAAYQPVMNMTGYFWDYLYYYYPYPTAGAVFWSYSYTRGSNITIAAIITYSNDTLTGLLGHGVTFISFAPSPSPNLGPPWSGWDGVGTWSPYPWLPGPGDYVLVCVTYSPSTNSLYGFAEDLNYPWLVSSFSVNLNGYFSLPFSGTYAFGVGAGTGYTYAADWSIVYVWEGS